MGFSALCLKFAVAMRLGSGYVTDMVMPTDCFHTDAAECVQ